MKRPGEFLLLDSGQWGPTGSKQCTHSRLRLESCIVVFKMENEFYNATSYS